MTDLLNSHEMASLNRALARRTGDRVRVGPEPISIAQGIALWNAAGSFAQNPATAALPERRSHRSSSRSVMVRESAAFRRVLGTGAVLAATASLSACATLGSNIQGNFSCRAPGGICAPTSTIDDAALALIGGDASVTPAGPYTPAPSAEPRMIQAAWAKPMRSGEKVLRIVFPAHIDSAGRFRETTAIHAVVERAAWMAGAPAPAPPVRIAAATIEMPAEVYAEAGMRSLGELASAAPEVRFPDPVAAIDAENAAGVSADMPAPDKVAASVATRAVHLSRPVASAGAGLAAPLAKGGGTSSSAIAPVRYSLPPKAASGGASPLDSIRAQVAERLKTSVPVTATKPRMAPPASGTIAAGTPASGMSSARPVNGPSLFPASEVTP